MIAPIRDTHRRWPLVRPLLAVLLAFLSVAGPAWAQPAEPAPGDAEAVPAVAVAKDDAPPAVEDSEPPDGAEADIRPGRRQNVRQIVEIGGSATVRTNQVAEGVVVVRGKALIDGDVDGDLVVVLGEVEVRGRVRGDLVVVMGEADIQGRVDGDSALVLTRSRIGPKARLGGELVAVGVTPDIDSRASLRHEPEIVSFGPMMRYFDWAKEYIFQGVFLLRPFPPGLWWVWVVAGICLALNLLVAALFPDALRGCADTLRERPARSFLVGLLTCVLVGPVSVLLSFAVVATPLIWLAYFALCVFGRVAVYGAAGSAVLRRPVGVGHPLGPVLAGSLLFYLSYMVPLLGFLVYWFVLPWGVGAALIRLLEALKRERRDPAPGGGGGWPARGGSLAAASALAGSAPGPATHAAVETPPPVSEPPSVPPEVPPIGAGPRPMPGPIPESATFSPSPLSVATLQRVGFGPRLASTVIDLMVVGFADAMTFQTGRAFWFLLAVYHLGFWLWKGTTLGGSVLGIRLVRLDGKPLDLATGLYRVLGAVVSLLPLGLGFLWVMWDAEYQSWHDRIAGTTVVKPERRPSLV